MFIPLVPEDNLEEYLIDEEIKNESTDQNKLTESNEVTESNKLVELNELEDNKNMEIENIIDTPDTIVSNEINKKNKIKINDDIPDELDLCDVDFGENMNNLLNEGKKEKLQETIKVDNDNKKIKIKVGKKKK